MLILLLELASNSYLLLAAAKLSRKPAICVIVDRLEKYAIDHSLEAWRRYHGLAGSLRSGSARRPTPGDEERIGLLLPRGLLGRLPLAEHQDGLVARQDRQLFYRIPRQAGGGPLDEGPQGILPVVDQVGLPAARFGTPTEALGDDQGIVRDQTCVYRHGGWGAVSCLLLALTNLNHKTPLHW